MIKKISFLIISLALWNNLTAQVTNYALKFDGHPNSYAYADVTELNNAKSFSFEAWIYIDQWIENSYIFQKKSDQDHRIDIQLGNNSSQRLYFHIANGNNNYFAIDNPGIAEGQWFHLAATYNGNNAAGDQVSLYINGNYKSGFFKNNDRLLPASTPNMPATFILGKNFKGKMDEIRLWNMALQKDELMIHNTINSFNSFYPNLISYWRVDQVACLSLVDYIKKHHAILSGNVTKEIVTNNPTFKYGTVTGYLRPTHWVQKSIHNENLLHVNDLIYMDGKPYANGEIFFAYPDNSGILSNISHLSNYKGRTGVLNFNGTNAQMTVGKDLLIEKPGIAVNKFTFEAWIYIDNWAENACLLQKATSPSQKVAIQLGNQASKQLVVKIANGSEKSIIANETNLNIGSWNHLAIIYNGKASQKINQVEFIINGNQHPDNLINLSDPINGLPVRCPYINPNTIIGQNFDGKMDEVRVWHSIRSIFSIRADKNEVITDNWHDTFLKACWRGDNSDNPGLDSQSWPQLLKAVKQVYDGYEGYKVRLGIAAGQWKEMVSNSTAISKFASEANKLLATDSFNGIDLDFEWCYNNTEWNNYSNCILAVNKAIPSEMDFSVTLHPLFYQISQAAIKAVDYIGFQNYGPSPARFTWNDFTSSLTNFRDWGYPNEKIQMGLPFYGVTSDNSKVTVTYKDIINQYPDLTPEIDEVPFKFSSSTKNITLNGVNTIKQKTAKTRDEQLLGIMFWDIGTDIKMSDSKCLLRALNEEMNANLQIPVTEVEELPTSLNNIKEPVTKQLIIYPNPCSGDLTIEMPKKRLTDSILQIHDLGGHIMKNTMVDGNMSSFHINVKDLPAGLYTVSISHNQNQHKAKLLIQ
ncbi:T9SS C-terminal target domain-containing protein [Marinilabiliaceae bacterium JC017]|nr:T9SS C-terminal target domain-containing protein [Marinilabiliaceae bacterium JC017]